MEKIGVFGKYLNYLVGGAELSTVNYLKNTFIYKENIVIYSFKNIVGFGARKRNADFPKTWRVELINNKYFWNRFVYIEYLMNRMFIRAYFKKLEHVKKLYVYGIYAPAAFLGFGNDVTFFVRSETDLGIRKNYQHGVKNILWYIYYLLEYPAYRVYEKDLRKMIKRSNVICNSNYMKKRLFDTHSVKCEVSYPIIEYRKLRNDYAIKNQESIKKGIVFVGDSNVKGLDLVLKIANEMPSWSFYIFSRLNKEQYTDNNITYMSWQENQADIYKFAKLVVVPSQWEEAYGRVAREAYLLGIHVLVSGVGGLPEAVDMRADCIVKEYKDPMIWKLALEKMLPEFNS